MKCFSKIFISIVGCGIFLTSLEGQHVNISSDQPVFYDYGEHRAIADGNARVTFDKDTYLLADKLTYEDNVFAATGQVQLDKDRWLYIGESIGYDNENQKISGENIRLGNSPIYLQAESVEGSLAHENRVLHIYNGQFYYGEPGPFTISVRAKHAKITGFKRIRFDSADVFLGKCKLAHIHKYTQMIYSPPFYVRGEYGQRTDLGFWGKQLMLLNAGEYIRYGAEVDLYSRRGVLVGPALEARYQSDWQDLTFKLRGGYIHDGGDLERDILGRSIDADRYFIDAHYKHQIGDSVTVTSTIYAWSDSDVERIFRTEEFTNNQFPDNFIELDKTFENSLASVLAQARLNDFQTVNQRLPEARYEMMPHQLLGMTLYHQGFVDAAYLKKEDAVSVLENEEVFRVDGYYGWESPVKFAHCLTVKPLAGLRTTYYERTLGDQGDYIRLVGQLGCDIQMDIVGEWDIQLPRMGIRGIKHVFQPVVQYRYLPKADAGDDKIIPIDTYIHNTYLPIIDLSEQRNVDELLSENVLRIGLQNLLMTKTRGPLHRTIAEANFYEDIRLGSDTSETTLSDIYSYFNLYPCECISLNLFTRFDVNSLTLNELSSGFTLRDGEIWKIRFSNEYFKDRTNQIRLDWFYQINTQTWFNAFWRIDCRLGSIVEQNYHLFRQLNRTWVVDGRVIVRSHLPRDERYQLSLSIAMAH